MGLIEEVTRMQEEGMSNQDISIAMQQQGVDKRKLAEVFNQAAIKSAVGSREDSPATITEYSKDSGMEQSVMNGAYSGQNNSQSSQVSEKTGQEQNYVDYSEFSNPKDSQNDYAPQEQNYSNNGYPPQASSVQGSDNISEIAEQVFDEKISSLSKKVEFVLDSKNETESKLESIDIRLQKIEKIIDRLQLSVLQKVGEYMTNVEDIKKEITETQKSFKYLLKDKNISQ